MRRQILCDWFVLSSQGERTWASW